MKLSPVIARLRDQVAAFSDRVGGAAEFEAAAEVEALAVPHAFVVPVGEIVNEDQTAGGVTQLVEDMVGIIVAVDNTADARGQAAYDAVEDVKTALQEALLGWEPAEGYSGFSYVGSTFLRIQRNRLWFQFDFSALNVIQS